MSIGVGIWPIRPCWASVTSVTTPLWRRYMNSSCSWSSRNRSSRHRVQVAVQAVEHDQRAQPLSTAALTTWVNSPGESRPGRSGQRHRARRDVRVDAAAEAAGAQAVGLDRSRRTGRSHAFSPRPAAATRVLRGERRLADPGRAEEQRGRAAVQPAAEQRVELGHAARDGLADGRSAPVGRHQRADRPRSPPVSIVMSW